MKTIQQLAQEVLRVQDACNLLGVSRAYPAALCDLRAALEASGERTRVEDHPITLLWVDKLASLSGSGLTNYGDVYDAFLVVEDLAIKGDVVSSV